MSTLQELKTQADALAGETRVRANKLQQQVAICEAIEALDDGVSWKVMDQDDELTTVTLQILDTQNNFQISRATNDKILELIINELKTRVEDNLADLTS